MYAASDGTTTGKVRLEFVSLSDSSVTVTLVNDLYNAIYIRGASRGPSGPIDVMSADSEIECVTLPKSPESGVTGETSLFAFVHGIGEWRYAEVPARGRATLIIETKFPQRHRGGHCRLQVRLKDETVVGTAEFNP
jgi:hypothetical protein